MPDYFFFHQFLMWRTDKSYALVYHNFIARELEMLSEVTRKRIKHKRDNKLLP